MCQPIKHENISVEFERDASLRATEVIIINHDKKGEEQQGVKFYCYDSGRIQKGVGVDLIDGEVELA